MSIKIENDDSTDLYDINKNNFEQVKNKANKIGFADGINEGRQQFFQNGFDQGYTDGLTASFDIEKFKFFFRYLNMDKINKDLMKEKEEFNKFGTDLKASIFKDNWSVVSKELVHETINQFAQKMPKAANLLNQQSRKYV